MIDTEWAWVQSLEMELRMEHAWVEGSDVGMRAEWSKSQQLQESMKMAQVGLESAQNELVLHPNNV